MYDQSHGGFVTEVVPNASLEGCLVSPNNDGVLSSARPTPYTKGQRRTYIGHSSRVVTI